MLDWIFIYFQFLNIFNRSVDFGFLRCTQLFVAPARSYIMGYLQLLNPSSFALNNFKTHTEKKPLAKSEDSLMLNKHWFLYTELGKVV